VGGCVHDRATGSAAIDPKLVACDAFGPVRWSHKDTPETIRQVVGNNAAGVRLCGKVAKWKPGK
jgi:hypothetical protein